jgi:hypothetical protein
MIREERAVLLGILTLIGFAFLVYLEFGSFIYPFPLNEVVFLIVAIQVFIWNSKAFRLISSLFVGAAISALLASEFFWSLFVDQEAWELLYHGVWLDIFKLTNLALTLVLMSLCLKPIISEKSSRSWTLIIPFLLLFASIPYDPIVETGAYIGMGIVAFIWKPMNPLHNLWVLLAGLNAMKLAMILI